MTAFYSDIVQDQATTRGIAGVQVLVLANDGTIAALTTSSGSATLNPVTTDQYGVFSFYAADGLYRLQFRYEGELVRQDTAIVGTPAAFVGATGPSNNTRATLAALKAAAITDLTSLYDGSLWTWQTSATPYTADDVNIVKADSTALSVGAWVRSGAKASGSRSSPEPAFNVVPFKVLANAGGVITSEAPLEYAFRTIANTGLVEAVYVSPKGDDTTGLGTATNPWRTILKALTTGTSSIIWAEAGQYPPFDMRGDIYPANFNRLRAIMAKGPVDIAWPADNLASNAVAATGTLTFAAVGTDADTATVNGVTFTLKTAPTGAFDVLIGGTAAATATNLAAALNRWAPVLGVTATVAGAVVTVTSTASGTAGNAIALAKSSTAITLSGATLAGGRNTWTVGTGQSWKFYLTPANKPPRAVLDHSKIDPDTGCATPMARYGNSVTFTYSGQPADGNTFTFNGFTYTFKTAPAGARQVQIGASLAASLANAVLAINGESVAVGVLADLPTASALRVMALLGATQTLTASTTGATVVAGAQVSGQTELDNLSLNTVSTLADNGGWYYDATNNLLWVRRKSDSIEASKADFELITADSGGSGDRCMVIQANIAFSGDICFKGTYLFLNEVGGARPQVFAEFKHPYGRVTGLCTSINVGLLENTGGFLWTEGHRGYCSHIDTAHLNDGTTAAPITILVNGASAYAGDQFTFPVIEYPNRNGVSAHSAASVTAVFGGKYHFSQGPEIAGLGKYWLLGVDIGPSRGAGNEIGIDMLAGGVAYADGCRVHGNKAGDVLADGGVVRISNSAFRTSSAINGGTVDTAWAPLQ